MRTKGALLIALALCLLLGTAAMGAGESVGAGGEVIRVGWFPLPGGSEVHDGVYSGYNYDYLLEIAKYTDWTYEFVEGDFSTCSHLLETGEIDIMGSLFYSEERAEVFDFPQLEYGHTFSTLFAAASSALQPCDFDAFNGMKVGVVSGESDTDSLEAFAAENGFTCETMEYNSHEELIDAVLGGGVDAGVSAGFHSPLTDARILAQFAPQPFYFATTKGNEKALVGLSRALSYLRISEPYLETELYNKHFGQQESVELTKKELEIVEASRTQPITVGLIPNNPPMCYLDSSKDEFDGIYVEFMRSISEKTGLQFEFVKLDLSQGPPVAHLKAGYPALVSGILKTDKFMNDRELVLSDAVIESALVIVGRIGEDYLDNPSEKTIAAVTGFQVGLEYIQEQFPEHKVIERETLEECLDAIESGEADATVYINNNISYLLHNPHYENLEINPAFQKHVEQCAAGLYPGKAEVIGIVNKGIAMISEAERSNIMTNFTLTNPYQLTLGDTLYKYRGPLAVIAALLLAVIAILSMLFVSRRRSAEKLRAAFEQEKAALLTAEKASAAKGNFMSRISHEIRTPLNAVIGYNSIARSEMTGEKTQAERRQSDMKVMDCLTKSDIASKHLLTVINDVLDMSAIESGKIRITHELFDFRNLISAITVLFFSQAAAKEVDFEVVFDSPTEEWFLGDQTRINQILTNLLSNAVKFTPGGGKVKLLIRQEEAGDRFAKIHFEVEDTGIGMDSEFLKYIWTPFEQADSTISRRFGGTGLGLSITKNLIDLLDGRIWVESERGVGSTFYVELELERTEQPVTANEYDFSHINALVVDDDMSTCDYIRLLFDRCGAKCRTVTSGVAAVEAIKSGSEFTLCLVDWLMPEMDGVETIRRIREIVGDGLPIIIVSAYDLSEIENEARELGVNQFISKPLFQSSVFDLLANICGRHGTESKDKRQEYDFHGARILLAEDNAMNMEVAKFQLTSANLTVDGVWNGAEAVAVFESAPAGTYKAILMDIQMPEMDGHEATRRIRASSHPDAARVPIIAMTADAFAEKVAEALASGMDDHIAKPINTDVLFRTLKKYIDD